MGGLNPSMAGLPFYQATACPLRGFPALLDVLRAR